MSKYMQLNKKIRGNSPGNILAQLFRDTVVRLDLISELPFLVEERLAELKRDPNTKKTRGSIDSEILSDNMTFNTFVNVLVNVVKVDDIGFVLDVRYGERKSLVGVNPKLKNKTKTKTKEDNA